MIRPPLSLPPVALQEESLACRHQYKRRFFRSLVCARCLYSGFCGTWSLQAFDKVRMPHAVPYELVCLTHSSPAFFHAVIAYFPATLVRADFFHSRASLAL